MNREQLKEYSRFQKLLYPDKPDVYEQVTNLYRDGRQTFTRNEILAATNPSKNKDDDYQEQRGEKRENVDGHPPRDAFSADEARQELARYEALNPGTKGLWAALLKKIGPKPWYRASELRDVEENGAKPRQVKGARPPGDPVGDELGKATRDRNAWVAAHPFLSGFRSPRVRQSWRDVLYDEDPSQPNRVGKSLGDLVGASLSYTHNGRADTDAWSIVGALIEPWRYGPDTDGVTLTDWRPMLFAVAPSVSVNRVDTNGDPKDEVDQLVARIGVYADWTLASSETDSPFVGMQARAAGVYITDTGGHGGLPGGELDLEPRWSGFTPIPLGYSFPLTRKEPLKDDGSDQSLIDFQLRTWLHLEGGDVQDTGKSWDPATGTFFRLGPTVQAQMNFVHLPPFDKDASLTVLYSYLTSVTGPDRHNNFLEMTAAYTLYKDAEHNHKVSLSVDYQRGGLNFTKQDVDTVTLGLSVLF